MSVANSIQSLRVNRNSLKWHKNSTGQGSNSKAHNEFLELLNLRMFEVANQLLTSHRPYLVPLMNVNTRPF